jgi:hypothetical protein
VTDTLLWVCVTPLSVAPTESWVAPTLVPEIHEILTLLGKEISYDFLCESIGPEGQFLAVELQYCNCFTA